MKALIIYDSVYGNTEQIARAIANAFSFQKDVQVLRVNDVTPEQLAGLTLLIVGSPTQRFRPTQAIANFFKRIPKHGLGGVKVAAFDTRISMNDVESRVLPFFVKIFGYAAGPIADRLEKKGGEPVITPEGFYVNGMEGPLKDGEPERAADWTRKIEKNC